MHRTLAMQYRSCTRGVFHGPCAAQEITRRAYICLWLEAQAGCASLSASHPSWPRPANRTTMRNLCLHTTLPLFLRTLPRPPPAWQQGGAGRDGPRERKIVLDPTQPLVGRPAMAVVVPVPFAVPGTNAHRIEAPVVPAHPRQLAPGLPAPLGVALGGQPCRHDQHEVYPVQTGAERHIDLPVACIFRPCS